MPTPVEVKGLEDLLIHLDATTGTTIFAIYKSELDVFLPDTSNDAVFVEHNELAVKSKKETLSILANPGTVTPTSLMFDSVLLLNSHNCVVAWL